MQFFILCFYVVPSSTTTAPPTEQTTKTTSSEKISSSGNEKPKGTAQLRKGNQKTEKYLFKPKRFVSENAL